MHARQFAGLLVTSKSSVTKTETAKGIYIMNYIWL